MLQFSEPAAADGMCLVLAGVPDTETDRETFYYYALLNASGTAVVTYTYDAWGKPLTAADTTGTGLAAINPLRYRGYVYDTETGLYYLQSRYYDPEVGRFINADAFAVTGQGILGNNSNSPITYSDDSNYNKHTGGQNSQWVIPIQKY